MMCTGPMFQLTKGEKLTHFTLDIICDQLGQIKSKKGSD